jgi:pimeloyl-ACP methyl ester carboxylesterase
MAHIEAAATALEHLAPVDLHQAIDAPDPVLEARSRLGLAWEELTFPAPVSLPAAFASRSWEPGTELATARVRVLRHAVRRPWVIVVHGAQQGGDLDLWTLRARHLHERLGLNVVMPVLPFHGHRRVGDGAAAPGLDVLTNVSTALIAVAEIRAVRRWIAAQDDAAVGLYGLSLGSYYAALAAGVERDFDLVLVAMPVVSLHRLIARHLVRSAGRDGRRLAALLLSAPVLAIERFVDPMAFVPTVPRQRRHVLGGVLDRVTPPSQAVQLAHHWELPAVRWYMGGHLGHAWSSSMRADVDDTLRQLHGVAPTTHAKEMVIRP